MRHAGIGIVVFFLSCAGDARAAVNTQAYALQEAFNKAAETAKTSVVNIQVVQEHQTRVYEPEFFFGIPDDFFDGFGPSGRGGRTYRWKTQGLGSGVIIDADGYVLTNAHVVKNADDIKATLINSSGKEVSYPAKIAGIDSKLDIAVVKIKTNERLPFLKLGDSDKIKVGDWAIAVGYPFGFSQTVTAGIVSSVKQPLVIEGRRYPKLIQTDAAINMGNSGGPLLNLEGEIIGINSAIFSPSGAFAGIGFAIPANDINGILSNLKAGRKIRRGWLGVTIAPLDEMVAQRLGLPVSEGALVNSVIQNSPAGRSGLRRGDIVTACDGSPVASAEDLIRQISSKAPGTKVMLDFFRKNSGRRVQAVLSEQPDEQTMGSLKEMAESPLEEPSRLLPVSWEGMEIRIINGSAEIAGILQKSKLLGHLQAGDIINGINQKAVKSEEDFKDASARANLAEGIVFDITRVGQPMYISVQVKQ